MQSSMSQLQQDQAFSLSSLYIQTFGARTYLDAFREAFPREAQNLVDVIIGQQKKKGVLLSANTGRRERSGVEDPAPAKRGPGGNIRDSKWGRHTRQESTGAEATIQTDSKDLPVQDDIQG